MQHDRTLPPSRILTFLASLVLTLGAAALIPGVEAAEPAMASVDAAELEATLIRAGANRAQLEVALTSIAPAHRDHLAWLILGMPETDLRTLDAAFLIEHVTGAVEAWEAAPWHAAVPVDVFREAILPYASVDERRDRWRPAMRARCLPLVEGITDAALATATLNRTLFPLVDVKYSTKRPKANQSPDESIEAGLASCTGLSILLIDACRSVGIPARFVGTPLWSDGSGNHSWVEVWHDGKWRFTGAAEPTGEDLDRGWFIERASRAVRDDPRHAIYATTWRRTPIHFPQVWSPDDTSIHAVNVTDRYTAFARESVAVPEGSAVVRFRLLDAAGTRVALPFRIVDAGGQTVARGTTRDEGFDANDHATAVLEVGRAYWLSDVGELTRFGRRFVVAEGEQRIDATLGEAEDGNTGSIVPGKSVESRLEAFLASGAPLETLAEEPWARRALSRVEAERARDRLVEAYGARIRAEREDEVDAQEITIGDHTLRWLTRTYGTRPEKGWALWISMHGGGGAPAATNDQQWRNQVGLYDATMQELGGSIVIAPRAPTNTWNLWHQAHIDGLFDRLITDAIFLDGVDPDRVYLIGYSAGGDGVYQLAPRMADRFAGAGMSAGHPNETRPDGLRNLRFALHMGANDSAYQRNAVARQWQQLLADLRDADPEGYDHQVRLHEGKGHWMDREDAEALPWLAAARRDLRPRRVVWLQDDVTHDRFYWLALRTNDVVRPTKGQRVVATLTDHGIEIEEARGVALLTIRLDDTMLDLDREFAVMRNGEILYGGRAQRTIATLARTLLERGDPRGLFSAEIHVPIPQEPGPDSRRE